MAHVTSSKSLSPISNNLIFDFSTPNLMEHLTVQNLQTHFNKIIHNIHFYKKYYEKEDKYTKGRVMYAKESISWENN